MKEVTGLIARDEVTANQTTAAVIARHRDGRCRCHAAT